MAEVCDLGLHYHIEPSRPKRCERQFKIEFVNDLVTVEVAVLPDQTTSGTFSFLELHKKMHDKTGISPKETGIYGGKYNLMFDEAVKRVSNYFDVSKEQVLAIEDDLLRFFGVK